MRSIKGNKRLDQDSLLTFPGAPCLEIIGFGALAGQDETSSVCLSFSFCFMDTAEANLRAAQHPVTLSVGVFVIFQSKQEPAWSLGPAPSLQSQGPELMN